MNEMDENSCKSCSANGVDSDEKSPMEPGAPNNNDNGKKEHHSAVIIMSALATMINTENIWRFPRVAAQHSNGQGCLLFVLAWLLYLPLWSIPMMLIEFGVGRYTGVSVYQSIRRLLGDRHGWAGLFVTAVTFLYGCTFLVTMSWCVYYVYYFSTHELPTSIGESNAIFSQHVHSAWPLLWEVYIIVPVCFVVIQGFTAVGVTNVLVVILIFITTTTVFIWQLTRQNAGLGIEFLFTPSWGTLTDLGLWTSALSHNAFDVGTGLCLILSYSTMLGPRNSVVKYAVLLPLADATISLMCAMLGFSLTFSILHQSAGQDVYTYSDVIDVLKQPGKADSGITFTWIPVLFARAGRHGRFMCVLYFIAISSAALTSFINLFEFTVRFLRDCEVPRLLSVSCIGLGMFIISLPSAMSTGMFINQSSVWRAATFISCLVLLVTVIKFGAESCASLMFNDYSQTDWRIPRAWVYLIKFVLPVELLLICVWYVVTEVQRAHTHGLAWYDLTVDSLTTAFIEWSMVLAACCLANVIACACIKTKQDPAKDYQPIND